MSDSDPPNDDPVDPTSDDTVDPTSDDPVDPTSDDTADPTSDDTADPTSDDTADPTSDDTADPWADDDDPSGDESPEDDAHEATDADPSRGRSGDARADRDGDEPDAHVTPAPGAPGRGVLVERAAAKGLQPAPPPRRTGVFVDVDELRAHIGSQLRAMLGGYEVDALGNMTFTSDGARIFVTVGPGPMGPHVGVFSIVTVDQPLTPELAQFLLTTNHRMAFGAFSYEAEQRAVWLRHALLGATLDAPELRSAIISVATSASTVAEVLRDRFGGGSFADAPAERQAAVHPPEPSHDDDGAVNVGGYL